VLVVGGTAEVVVDGLVEVVGAALVVVAVPPQPAIIKIATATMVKNKTIILGFNLSSD
jgi:hypothetical protein